MNSTTPMMRQYSQLKAAHPDAILLFRLGDFYEMFGDDARQGSATLGLTLTQRQGVPMCGVPYHAARGYIGRLLRTGLKVAVCEQTSLQSDTPGLAERRVVEVLSPGTVFDDDYLQADRNNYLLAVARVRHRLVYAWVDASTGEFFVAGTPVFPTDAGTMAGGESLDAVLSREITRLAPAEILIQESLIESSSYARGLAADRATRVITRYPDWSFDADRAYRRLCELFDTATLHGFGFDHADADLAPVAVLLDYLEHNAQNVLRHLRGLRRHEDNAVLLLDESTQRNLELVRNLQDGSRHFTLLSVLDQTINPMGARTIRHWICSPPRQRAVIERRTAFVAALYHDQSSLSRVRALLRRTFDLERLIGRLGVDKAQPRDLRAIGETVVVAIELLAFVAPWYSAAAGALDSDGGRIADLAGATLRMLNEELPAGGTDGAIVRDGVDAEIDRLRGLIADSEGILESYVDQRRRECGIGSLKLRYNRVLGHFFEVPRSQAERVPADFVRRQSVANAERFSTARLVELEAEINSAGATVAEREYELFLALRHSLAAEIPSLQQIAIALAELDAVQSLAYAATERGYVQAELCDEPCIMVNAGRHPVVEANMAAGEFVPNSLRLDVSDRRFALITGPNMAGKSTVLRQTALIVLMAHIGSFVPATAARIGIADRIFCRVGASDNIARGESTFLVEMNEASYILRTATDRSVIIMDEVGRGTSTHDGLSIAYAISEYLLEQVKARTLFATHYHELTALDHAALLQLRLAVDHDGDRLRFLKRLEAGTADRSYGIDVARMAGVPDSVIARARELLAHFERRSLAASVGEPLAVPTAKSAAPPLQPAQAAQAELFDAGELILTEIAALTPDELSPREALARVYRWRDLLR